MSPSKLSLAALFAMFAIGCSDFSLGDRHSAKRGATLLDESTDDDSDTTGAGDDDDDDTNTGDDDDNDDDDDDDDDDTGAGDDDDDDEDEADLPYAVELDVGDTFVLWDAFAEEGPLPTAILEVTMEEGGSWRLLELQSLTPFTVEQADCDHEGNRDTGRDRIEVRWVNPDGSEDEDHLDLRYCGA